LIPQKLIGPEKVGSAKTGLFAHTRRYLKLAGEASDVVVILSDSQTSYKLFKRCKKFLLKLRFLHNFLQLAAKLKLGFVGGRGFVIDAMLEAIRLYPRRNDGPPLTASPSGRRPVSLLPVISASHLNLKFKR
jgi:hypothetical protein